MSSFFFTKVPPEEQMYTDIKSLNKFDEKAFCQLVDIVFSFLVSPKEGTRFMSQVSEFAGEHGVSTNALKNVVKSLLGFFKSALKSNLTPAQVKEDLEHLGLSAENSPHVSERWKANLVALSRSVVGQTFMVNQLVDMEWKFGVTAGSSDLKVVGQTFLQLKMVVDRGGTQEDVFMELTLPQFYSFLHEMERAKSTLEYFS
ncbi:COMM domain-containing protein 7-like [Orbicella faveolata]|uniref:COMM domain-containing protein 7-like n=1 Tax=Orbicella faveolata TaxID=48498 RepID=UPI0009E4CDFA|nr:COMM domain-containing protein 7-like [Orbicella faveolata]